MSGFLLWNIDLTRPGKSIHIIFRQPSYRIQLKKHVNDSGDKALKEYHRQGRKIPLVQKISGKEL